MFLFWSIGTLCYLIHVSVGQVGIETARSHPQSTGTGSIGLQRESSISGNYFLSSSARIAAAMAKATVMRLAGTPSLPVIESFPSKYLAYHHQLGAADFCDLRQAPQQAHQGPSQAP